MSAPSARTIRFTASQADRVIAFTRVAMAAFSLFAIWLDPAEPARYAEVTYSLHATYVAYSVLIGLLVWTRVGVTWLPLATHIADLAIFSVFQYLTMGPSSPFFVYFVFALFCAALRWGWRGTLLTIPVVVLAFVAIGYSMSSRLGPTEFELNRFIIRVGYLIMVGSLLAYLGRHEDERRVELQRLARWPRADDTSAEKTEVILRYTSEVMGAETAILLWSLRDEPRTTFAEWSRGGWRHEVCSPEAFDPPVSEALSARAFICAAPFGEFTRVLTQRPRGAVEWIGRPVHPGIAARLVGLSAGSAAFETERVTGRLFVSWAEPAGADLLPLLEAVARQVGTSLDQASTSALQRQLAVGDERIRLARDLHDGVLQSLTGVRLELQRLAEQDGSAANGSRDRLLSVERVLALEQRELRLFIEGLRPLMPPSTRGDVIARLRALRERLFTQWRVPIDLRLPDHLDPLPEQIDQALVPLAQEGIVNAIKHAHPTRVRVSLEATPTELHVIVEDDGHGFSFSGQLDHAALVKRGVGPVSLRERAASIGGRLRITSSPTGSRLDIAIPCPAGD